MVAGLLAKSNNWASCSVVDGFGNATNFSGTCLSKRFIKEEMTSRIECYSIIVYENSNCFLTCLNDFTLLLTCNKCPCLISSKTLCCVVQLRCTIWIFIRAMVKGLQNNNVKLQVRSNHDSLISKNWTSPLK